jgi:hypothetical protein
VSATAATARDRLTRAGVDVVAADPPSEEGVGHRIVIVEFS